MAPPLQVGHQGLGSKSPDIGRKIGRNLSEDFFFFFCSSSDFGRKMGRNVSEDLFFLLFTWFGAKDGTKFECDNFKF